MDKAEWDRGVVRGPRHNALWDDAEIAAIKHMHNKGRSYSSMSKVLKRTVSAIHSKLYRMRQEPGNEDV